jgi:hypothetical protein
MAALHDTVLVAGGWISVWCQNGVWSCRTGVFDGDHQRGSYCSGAQIFSSSADRGSPPRQVGSIERGGLGHPSITKPPNCTVSVGADLSARGRRRLQIRSGLLRSPSRMNPLLQMTAHIRCRTSPTNINRANAQTRCRRRSSSKGNRPHKSAQNRPVLKARHLHH